MEIRKGAVADLPVIMTIMDQARIAQRKIGFRQWEDDYPSPRIILDDIDSGRGYVWIDSTNTPVGYATIVINDKGYDSVIKRLRLRGDFAVIHRMAISDDYRGKGYSIEFFRHLEQKIKESGIRIVRVDTGEKNIPMLQALRKLNYSSLGLLEYSWGVRYTFEKEL